MKKTVSWKHILVCLGIGCSLMVGANVAMSASAASPSESPVAPATSAEDFATNLVASDVATVEDITNTKDFTKLLKELPLDTNLVINTDIHQAIAFYRGKQGATLYPVAPLSTEQVGTLDDYRIFINMPASMKETFTGVKTNVYHKGILPTYEFLYETNVPGEGLQVQIIPGMYNTIKFNDPILREKAPAIQELIKEQLVLNSMYLTYLTYHGANYMSMQPTWALRTPANRVLLLADSVIKPEVKDPLLTDTTSIAFMQNGDYVKVNFGKHHMTSAEFEQFRQALLTLRLEKIEKK